MKMDPTQERQLSRNIFEQVVNVMDENNLRKDKTDNDLADEITGMMVDKWKKDRGLD